MDEHPFLTPKGLRLQLQGRRVDSVVPMPMPVYPSDYVPRRDDDPEVVEPIDPFEFDRGVNQPLINIRPSAKFPNPAVLGDMSLAGHFRSGVVSQTLVKELQAVGRLFIQTSSDAQRELASGSAWISGPSTIVTCAHNVYDFSNRQWSLRLEFHAGYDYYSPAKRPSCRVTSCYIPRSYMDNPATNHDIAICYVDRNIGDLVGSQFEMRSVPDNNFLDRNTVAIVGYPAGSGFDFGKQMRRSVGTYLFGQSAGGDTDFAPAMATDFGGGASGCPWLTKDPDSGETIAIGVTSGHAKLRYLRGEANLQSLVSPFFGAKLFDALADDPMYHDFEI